MVLVNKQDNLFTEGDTISTIDGTTIPVEVPETVTEDGATDGAQANIVDIELDEGAVETEANDTTNDEEN